MLSHPSARKYEGVELRILTYAGQTYQPALKVFAAGLEALTGASVQIVALPAPYGWWAMGGVAQGDIASTNPQFDIFCDDGNWTGNLWPELLPLNGLIEQFGYDIGDFFEPVHKYGTNLAGQTGVRYGLPIRQRVRCLFYRTDLIPEFPATWEGYERVLADLKREGIPGIAVAGAGYPFHPYGQAYELSKMFIARYWSGGEPILAPDYRPLINSPQGVAALESVKRHLDRFAAPEVYTWDDAAAARAFLDGQTATIECCPNFLLPFLQDPARSKIVDRWSIAPYPGAGGGYFTMHEMRIFKHTRYPEAAFEFIAYCTNVANARRLLGQYGETVARKSPWLDLQVTQGMPHMPALVTVVDRGIQFAVGLPQWLEMLTTVWEICGYYLYGYMPARAALDIGAQKWTQLLRQAPPSWPYWE
ncbi:MAG: extracellular solute-binding protein [Chloroflexi bacterium]|nr:extracellular solute-binding protein [Chloroflexota bacterium]